MKNEKRTLKVLSLAGFDPFGAAGVLADIKTIHNHGLYSMGIATSLTAQNTINVKSISHIDKKIVKNQLDSIYEDEVIDGVKIGMLGSLEVNNLIINKLKDVRQRNIVFDPVMVSSSGKKLISNDTIAFIKNEMLQIVDLITPNIMEAEVLSDTRITNEEDIIKTGNILMNKTKGRVLIKGGHIQFNKSKSTDYLFSKDKILKFQSDRIVSENTHGTGCLLSSAITCNLAKGLTIEEAISKGKEYLLFAISNYLDVGRGKKPVNHLYCRNFK